MTSTCVDAPLNLAVWLTYHDPVVNSAKYHHSLLVGRTILIHFGRVHTSGQHTAKVYPTADKAQAAYWALLRSKVGKGYHVDAATVTTLDCAATVESYGYATRAVIHEWEALEAACRSRRQLNPGHPEQMGRSPRTPRQGAGVIAELVDPNAGPDALLEAALAAPSERFLYPLVLSHPACPDEARVARALATGLVGA